MRKSYEHLNHEKFKIRYHLIFSTKYRKKLLGDICDDIKSYMRIAESRQDKWRIEAMEIDCEKCDHIHFLIRATPTCVVADIIHKLKQTSTYYAWHEHFDYMSSWYWRGKHHLWTRGYFCGTVGDMSEEKLKDYIEKQG